jgi:hypothetical protein
LKLGGSFLLITPNTKNPLVFLSKFLPFSLHNYYREKLLKKLDRAHPTYYRMNTTSALKQAGKASGFSAIRITTAGNPEYLAIARPLITPLILLEKELFGKRNIDSRMYIIGRFIK